MIDLNISENEKTCLRLLNKLFMAGDISQRESFRNELQTAGANLADLRNFRVVMGLMEEYGAIKEVRHEHDGRANVSWFDQFQISPKTVILARELEELERKAKEPGDIVTETTNIARRSRILAYTIICFIISATVFTTFNGCVQAVTTSVSFFTQSPQPAPVSAPALPPPQAPIVNNFFNVPKASQLRLIDDKHQPDDKQTKPPEKDPHAPDR